jgi:CheY-like chemotaxis protein
MQTSASRESLLDLPALIIDDNATNRRILVEMLKSWHMQPQAAESGLLGLDRLRAATNDGDPFALVLLDAMMPDLDGFAVADQILNTFKPNPPTLMMLSSAASAGDRARCMGMGIADYLTKPVKQSELLEAILKAMGPTAAEPARVEAVIEQTPVPIKKYRFLVAEDNPVNQKLIVRLLEKEGHQSWSSWTFRCPKWAASRPRRRSARPRKLRPTTAPTATSPSSP